MNIFYLHDNPEKCAQAHHDKHVVKMILELAQLMSTAHRVVDGIEFIDNSSGRKIKRWALSDNRDSVLYKATHINHPSAKWVRESYDNYAWTYQLFFYLCKEYTYRYGKTHLCETKLMDALGGVPNKMVYDSKYPQSRTKIPQAMPDYCKRESSLDAYRTYYINEKKSQSKYTKRNKPDWL